MQILIVGIGALGGIYRMAALHGCSLDAAGHYAKQSGS
jgi:hypothetical protein